MAAKGSRARSRGIVRTKSGSLPGTAIVDRATERVSPKR